ncbi:MAG: hypothetical protein WD267_03750 [Balneolales bacterium]
MQNIDTVHLKILSVSFVIIIIIIIIIGTLVVPQPARGQGSTGDDLWLQYEKRQTEYNEAGRVLLTWGVAGMIGGGLFSLTDIGDFGRMTAGWGIVTTVVAATSLLNPVQFTSEKNDIADLLRYEQRYNRIVAIKTGLSLSYTAVGLGMARYGETRKVTEYGAAIFAQGAFFLVYDSVLLYLSSRHLSDLSVYPSIISSVLPDQTTNHSGGITLNIQF